MCGTINLASFLAGKIMDPREPIVLHSLQWLHFKQLAIATPQLLAKVGSQKLQPGGNSIPSGTDYIMATKGN